MSELCPVSLSRNIDDALIDAMRTQLAASEISGASLHAEHHSLFFFFLMDENESRGWRDDIEIGTVRRVSIAG